MHYYLAKVLNRLGFLKKVNTTVARRINGMTIHVPLVSGMGYDNLHISEVWMCQLLERIISIKRGAFVDVGVNLGQTLVKLRTVDPTMEYLGFEPNPKCIYYCNALIEANNFKHCRLVPVGLFNEDTVLELNLYSEGGIDSAASVINNFRPDQRVYQKIYVPVSRFDTVNHVLGITSMGFIKIDVEGAELEVLESLQTSIGLHRPILLMEILPCYTKENTFRIHRQEKIEAILKQLDYRIIRIHKKENISIENMETLQSIGIHGNMEWCDYVLSPSELTDRILF